MGALVTNALARHFKRWPILGYAGPAPELEPVPTSYTAELEALKTWIDTRLAWLDENIPGNCPPDPTGMADIATTALTVAPNPGKGWITLSGWKKSNSPQRLVVYAMNGAKVLDQSIQPSETNFRLQLNDAGIYLYQLMEENGGVMSGKVVVE